MALECVGLMGASVSMQQSLERQAGLMAAARDAASQAELYDAYAIMAGEITAEQSEQLMEEIAQIWQETLGARPEEHRAKRKEEIDRDLSAVETTMSAVQRVFGTLALEGADCKGQKVSFKTKANEKFDRLRTWLDTRGMHQQQKEQFRQLMLADQADNKFTTDPEKCGNKQAVKAYQTLKQDPLVASWKR